MKFHFYLSGVYVYTYFEIIASYIVFFLFFQRSNKLALLFVISRYQSRDSATYYFNVFVVIKHDLSVWRVKILIGRISNKLLLHARMYIICILQRLLLSLNSNYNLMILILEAFYAFNVV